MQDPVKIHKKLRGKIFIGPKAKIRSAGDLATLYTPGVAKPCLEIARDRGLVYEYTMKSNTVAIVTDGTRVLGLGDIGPEAALPVMEGKALIMQQFAGIDAFPICLATKDAEEIIRTVKIISPVFGAINLEDIESPKVFYIERRLSAELDIPVFHDDQHGTAIVTLAGLYTALRVLGKKDYAALRIAIVGAGSAGYAIARLLHAAGFTDLVVFDSGGAISSSREGLEEYKQALAGFNRSGYSGPLSGFAGADVLISAASPGSIPLEAIRSMRKPNIVFALSNPVPELSLEQAKKLGIDIFGTGRSDYPNQINNSLCFPGFLRALLDLRVRRITDRMKIAAARGISEAVKNPSRERIVPEVFDKSVVRRILGNIRKEIG
ncbi:MAG: NADP-dependent malic enzyme [Candidatus Micrarchaeia archaeon]